jgi:Zn-dependent peptidase ImmA (M78 family)/DNA-binding XRE family transcriptional regulator
VGKGIPALVTPSVLRWAREQVRLPAAVAAKRAAVSEARLLSWEQDEAKPSLRQARLLAAAYRLPLAAFYLDEVPDVKIHLPKDYRRLAGELMEEVSSSIVLDVRGAWERREIALELMALQGLKAQAFTLTTSLDSDPEVAGRLIRGRLAVPVGEQARWRDPRTALNGWRKRVEDLGVLVLQTSDVPVAELRAYSLHSEVLPVVVLNRKDPPAARLFSLFHELAHLTLHTEGLCDLTTEVHRRPEEQRLEVFCNAVAAACLMPKEALLDHPIVRGHGSGPVWADADIEELARHFSVSREALLRRLLTFGLTTTTFYEKKRGEYRKEYENRPKSRAIVTPPVNALSLLGRPLVGLVIASLDAGRITTADAADYLGVRLKHIPTLASALSRQ